MPHADPQKRLEYQRKYRNTPEGRAAVKRSRDRFVAKRKAMSEQPSGFNPAPLAQALSNWRPTC